GGRLTARPGPDRVENRGGARLPVGLEWAHPLRTGAERRPTRLMMTTLKIPRIDCSRDDARGAILELRRQLSPRGDVVSPQGRARTLAASGEPLTPQQVVERICADVQCRGLDALLDYTARLDGVSLEPGDVRVRPDELAAAFRRADPAYLRTVRRVRDNILTFQ